MPHSMPGLDLGYLVLEALERRQLAFMNDNVVAQQAHAGTARDMAW